MSESSSLGIPPKPPSKHSKSGSLEEQQTSSLKRGREATSLSTTDTTAADSLKQSEKFDAVKRPRIDLDVSSALTHPLRQCRPWNLWRRGPAFTSPHRGTRPSMSELKCMVSETTRGSEQTPAPTRSNASQNGTRRGHATLLSQHQAQGFFRMPDVQSEIAEEAPKFIEALTKVNKLPSILLNVSQELEKPFRDMAERCNDLELTNHILEADLNELQKEAGPIRDANKSLAKRQTELESEIKALRSERESFLLMKVKCEMTEKENRELKAAADASCDDKPSIKRKMMQHLEELMP